MTQNVVCMSMYMYVVYIYLIWCNDFLCNFEYNDISSCMYLVHFSQCEQLEGEMVSYLQLQRSQLHRAMDVLHTYATIISQVNSYTPANNIQDMPRARQCCNMIGKVWVVSVQVCSLCFPVWHKFCWPEQDRVLPNVASGGSVWFYFRKVNTGIFTIVV